MRRKPYLSMIQKPSITSDGDTGRRRSPVWSVNISHSGIFGYSSFSSAWHCGGSPSDLAFFPDGGCLSLLPRFLHLFFFTKGFLRKSSVPNAQSPSTTKASHV